VSRKKAFPLRLDPEVYDAVRRWAEDELRSANAQIEFLLARALREAGRHPKSRARGGGERPSRPRRS
jgi:hypothetical protein